MKLTNLAVVVLLGLMLMVMGAITGCSAPKEVYTRETMMQKLHEGAAGFVYIDLAAMREDSDLSSLYGSLCEGIPLASDDVDVVAWGPPAVLKGSIDTDGLRYELEHSEYFSRQEYHGVDIWTLSNEDARIAIIGDIVIFGSDYDARSVMECIDVTKGGAPSLYDREDFRDMLARLPEGVVVSCGPRRSDPYYQWSYEGLKATGYSMNKKNSGTMGVEQFYEFESEAAAQEAVGDIENDLGTLKVSNVSIVQRNRSVEITCDIGIDCLRAMREWDSNRYHQRPTDPLIMEQSYDTERMIVHNMVNTYIVAHNGELPPHYGTIDILFSDKVTHGVCDIIDICSIVGYYLQRVPEGCYGESGEVNTNFYSGNCENPSEGHYIWLIDSSGSVYSTCVGEDCNANNEDGYQGVYP